MKRTVLVVDEASLASTEQMRNLLTAATTLRLPRVVLVGDEKQLDGVDAGKPFSQLRKAGMATAVMGDILRQQNASLKKAVVSTLSEDVRTGARRAPGGLPRPSRIPALDDVAPGAGVYPAEGREAAGRGRAEREGRRPGERPGVVNRVNLHRTGLRGHVENPQHALRVSRCAWRRQQWDRVVSRIRMRNTHKQSRKRQEPSSAPPHAIVSLPPACSGRNRQSGSRRLVTEDHPAGRVVEQSQLLEPA